MNFDEAAVFVRVVQAGSFSAAARQLGLPTSTVSTRVSRLERRLGATLLQRTTRRLRLTEVGDLYYRHAAIGLAHMLEAEAAVNASGGEPRGRLRATVPADFGDAILADLIVEVRRAHPGIDVELVLTDRLLDLVAEGIDIALRVGALPDSSLVARRVGIACWAAFASPAYLRSAPPLAKPQDLGRHRCVQFTPLGKEEWTLTRGTDSVTVPMARAVVVNDIRVVRTMAVAGEGVALLPTYQCRAEVEKGELVRVMPEWRARAAQVHLVYPRQQFVPPKLRAFVDIAAVLLSRELEPAEGNVADDPAAEQ